MTHPRRLRSITLAAGALALGAAGLSADEPLELVPADSLLCWYSHPTEAAATPVVDKAATLANWVNLGARLVGRPLDSELLIWLRVMETMGQLTRYPHAIALLDARARVVGRGGRRVDRLKLAIIVKTDGDSSPFRRTIQTIVNEQTDAGTARLRRAKAGKWLFQTLSDRRLPAWASISWGDIGDYFVITLGDGVWADVADVAQGKTPSIGRDKTWQRLRDRHDPQPSIEIFAAFQAIRQRLDALVDGRATEFLNAWHAAEIEKSHWAIGFEDRGLSCVANFLREGQVVKRIFAHPSFGGPALREAVPSEARYAIFKVSPSRLVPKFVESLVATRNRKARDNVRRLWAQIQHDRGFDAQRDLLDNLGDYVVLHDYPPHPLRIPLMFTMLVEIRKQPQRVSETIDTMCSGWQAGLEQIAARSDQPNLLSLRHDDDGIWYLQIGFIAGPAWIATDRFVITSWSPTALRRYLTRAGATAGRRSAN